MTTPFAVTADLTARLSGGAYAVPANATQLLLKASELIDFHTMGRAQIAWEGSDADMKTLLTRATCDQVEYWLEVGEEHDVLGLRGSLQGGRVQIQRLPPYLGPRARRALLEAGLAWAGARSQ